ncbi:DUF6221 family protein [Streptomyces harbinensis]|uniref:DUF6221 family protein n=1 Tax=Streptomyces harbinensis TaxID=1176198 RepID=UPI0036BF8845
MNEMIEFLRARLGEEQDAAEAASPGPWHLNAEHDEVHAVDGEVAAEAFALSNNQLRRTAEHIARWDPERVLREVEAKRRLIEHCEDARRRASEDEYDSEAAATRSALEDALLAIASAHSGHPDFREEWLR